MIDIAASFSLAAPAFFSRTGQARASGSHWPYRGSPVASPPSIAGCGRALADLCGKPPVNTISRPYQPGTFAVRKIRRSVRGWLGPQSTNGCRGQAPATNG